MGGSIGLRLLDMTDWRHADLGGPILWENMLTPGDVFSRGGQPTTVIPDVTEPGTAVNLGLASEAFTEPPPRPWTWPTWPQLSPT